MPQCPIHQPSLSASLTLPTLILLVLLTALLLLLSVATYQSALTATSTSRTTARKVDAVFRKLVLDEVVGPGKLDLNGRLEGRRGRKWRRWQKDAVEAYNEGQEDGEEEDARDNDDDDTGVDGTGTGQEPPPVPPPQPMPAPAPQHPPQRPVQDLIQQLDHSADALNLLSRINVILVEGACELLEEASWKHRRAKRNETTTTSSVGNSPKTRESPTPSVPTDPSLPHPPPLTPQLAQMFTTLDSTLQQSLDEAWVLLDSIEHGHHQPVDASVFSVMGLASRVLGTLVGGDRQMSAEEEA
ncbi:hypothetical protein HK104_003397, partial [Borealophlyctis nickersoniae]